MNEPVVRAVRERPSTSPELRVESARAHADATQNEDAELSEARHATRPGIACAAEDSRADQPVQRGGALVATDDVVSGSAHTTVAPSIDSLAASAGCGWPGSRPPIRWRRSASVLIQPSDEECHRTRSGSSARPGRKC